MNGNNAGIFGPKYLPNHSFYTYKSLGFRFTSWNCSCAYIFSTMSQEAGRFKVCALLGSNHRSDWWHCELKKTLTRELVRLQSGLHVKPRYGEVICKAATGGVGSHGARWAAGSEQPPLGWESPWPLAQSAPQPGFAVDASITARTATPSTEQRCMPGYRHPLKGQHHHSAAVRPRLTKAATENSTASLPPSSSSHYLSYSLLLTLFLQLPPLLLTPPQSQYSTFLIWKIQTSLENITQMYAFFTAGGKLVKVDLFANNNLFVGQ